MQKPNLKSQRGAVLAFSLLMLLLLTIAGTRMIQQNKQQLEMANSARVLTQEFANAEGKLAHAKNMIDEWEQHIDSDFTIRDSSHVCKPTASFKQNIGLAQVLNSDATILSVTCFGVKDSNTGLPKLTQVCSSYDEATKKVKCNPSPITNADPNKTDKTNTDCKTVDDAIAAFTDPANICYQQYDPQGDTPDESVPITSGKCPKEVYKIKVISTNANGSSRTIISDHVVGCG